MKISNSRTVPTGTDPRRCRPGSKFGHGLFSDTCSKIVAQTPFFFLFRSFSRFRKESAATRASRQYLQERYASEIEAFFINKFEHIHEIRTCTNHAYKYIFATRIRAILRFFAAKLFDCSAQFLTLTANLL